MLKTMLDKTLENIWMENIWIEIIEMIIEGLENIEDNVYRKLKVLIYVQHKLID